jgi:hypothetical protein
MIRWRYYPKSGAQRSLRKRYELYAIFQMKKEQRDLSAKALVDLANIGAGAMMFGQFVSGQKVDGGVMVLGLAFALILYVRAFSVSKERGGERKNI